MRYISYHPVKYHASLLTSLPVLYFGQNSAQMRKIKIFLSHIIPSANSGKREFLKKKNLATFPLSFWFGGIFFSM
jgi:hypothetical protein